MLEGMVVIARISVEGAILAVLSEADELAETVIDGTRKQFMESVATVPLLIIDDFGMRKLPLTAAEDLLEIIMRDKTWNAEVPRRMFVAILELLTPPKPKVKPADTGKTAGGIEIAGKVVTETDPQALLVAAYRRKLSMALN